MHLVCNSLSSKIADFLIKTLKIADQIYTYLIKLKLNMRVGPYSNYKKIFMVAKNKCSILYVF